MQASEEGGIDNVCSDRYVAFLDLLGFKYEVEAAEKDHSRWPHVLDALRLVRETLCESPELDMHLTYFSDCMVMSAKRTPLGLAEMLFSIEALTFNLMQIDVLVRGGLTAGNAYHDQNFVFGTAVNCAYLLESDKKEGAKFPLVLVSPVVMDDVRGLDATYLDFFRQDGSDRWFVDYLARFATYRHMPIYSGKVIMDDPAQRVRDFICHRLRRDTGSVRDKAQWVADYWNREVASQGVFKEIDESIEPLDTSRGPTRFARRRIARS